MRLLIHGYQFSDNIHTCWSVAAHFSSGSQILLGDRDTLLYLFQLPQTFHFSKLWKSTTGQADWPGLLGAT